MRICLSVFSGVLAALYFLFCFAASVYFILVVDNYHASAFVFVSGIISLCTLHLNTLYWKGNIRDWYGIDQLANIELFALLVALLSTVFFGVYLSLGIVREQSYTLKTFSYYVAATSSGASSLWGLTLFLWALFYRKDQIRYPLLFCRAPPYSRSIMNGTYKLLQPGWRSL